MNMKWFPKSKTFWFGVLYIAIGIAGMFGYSNYQPTPEVQQWLAVATGVIILVLRYLTDRPISIKRPFVDQLTKREK